MLELIIFEVAGHQMGVLAESVIEIVRAVAVTELPDCQPPFVGVLNYRGTTVPAVRLNATAQPSVLEHMLLVQQGQAGLICLVVDRVLNFTTADQLLTLAELNKTGFQNLKLTRELAKVGNDLIPLLNLEALQNQTDQIKELAEQADQAEQMVSTN